MFSLFRKRLRQQATAAGVLAVCVAAPAFAFEATTLFPPGSVGQAEAQPRILVAQADDPAQMGVRIQQLEEQIRQLTGQVEGLTFQLTQMQTILERMQADTDFRFNELEGGGSGNGEAEPQSGGDTPAGEVPQVQPEVAPTIIPEQGVRPLPGEQEFDPTFDDGSVPQGDQSLVDGDAPASAPPIAEALPVETVLGEPLNLSFTPDMDTGNPDADAQFAAAYEALQSGDTEFAESQFAQFVALYPDNPQTPDAANWLGEALLTRGANQEAAEVLLNAYTETPEHPRAPDLLLRLGIALARAEERDTACRTLNEIPNRFENLTEAFRARLETEITTAQCPPPPA